MLTSTGACSRSAQILFDPPPKGQRQIGLIHHLPFAILPHNALGSRVEQVFLCGTHAKMYLAINYVCIASCVAGKSCLFRKSDLERAAEIRRRSGKGLLLAEGEGGLAAFGKYLGEDNMIGESLWNDLGMRHAMGEDLAANPVGTMSLNSFFRRRVRWIRVRKYMVVYACLASPISRVDLIFFSFDSSSTLVEPLTECFLCGLIGGSSLRYFFSLPVIITLISHIVACYFIDCILFHQLSRASPSVRSNIPSHDGPGWTFLRAWLVRELMALPIWAFAMLGNTVGWRDDGKSYRVLMNGSVQLVKASEKLGYAERTFSWVASKLQ